MKRWILTAAVLAATSTVASAQVTLQLVLRNPMPSQLSVWEQDPTVVQLLIVNGGRIGVQNAGISFTIRDLSNNALVANSKDNDPSLPRFTIPISSTITRYGKDVVSLNSVDINQQYKDIALNTNAIPEGDYEFCVRLIDVNGTEIATTGVKCRTFSVVIPDPPTLTNPLDKSVISSKIPPTFSWTPVILGGGLQTKYNLTISPIYQGQSPRNAIDQNTPLLSTPVFVPTYFYSPSNPPFTLYPAAVGFAWQVQALDVQGHPATRNEGKSEVFSFTLDTASAPVAQGGGTTAGGACDDPCVTSAPSNQTPGGSFVAGDQLRVGLFTMTLTQVSGTGAGLSGTGTIPVPFLKAPILVAFNNIQVNSLKQVYAGEVDAVQAQGSPIPQALANQLGSGLGMSQNQVNDIYSYASQGSRLVSALVLSSPTALPIGFDKSIDGDRLVIAIFGMVFQPTMAKLNAVTVFTMADLGPNTGFGLGAREICFHPNGISSSQGNLYLAADVGYNNAQSFNFVFKAPALPADSGTFVTWDCQGFKELHLEAEVGFPRDWMLPSPDDGVRLVKAHLKAIIQKQNDWVGAATLDKCTLAGATGFGLAVQDMYYDHSDLRNPPGIIFPAGYAKSTGPDWHGFFIKQATLTLPQSIKTFNGAPPSMGVSNMLIDATGLTASVYAANIIQYPQGNFGEWGASIDSLRVNFVSSSLTDSRMSGRIQIPISDDPLAYSAILSHPQNADLQFEFVIQPQSAIRASLWAAMLTLDPTSRVTLTNANGAFDAKATLDGHLDIHGKVGSLPDIDFQLVKFQNMGLTTKSPYLVSGTWSMGSPAHGVMGFPVSLKNISFQTANRSTGFGVGLRFDVNLDLSDALSGGTTLSIWGALPLKTGIPQKFQFDGVDLDAIHVHSDLGVVTIDGSIMFYHDDPTFGNGFRGDVAANFVHAVDVQATAQFGKVNGFRYWYVDASALIPAGIGVFPGVGFYGFGGGAWYHMNVGPDPAAINGTPSPNPPLGLTKSGYKYSPDQSIAFGFKALVIMGTYPAAQLFSGDLIFTMQFTNGGVGAMSLVGKGYFISPTIDQRSSALILATASISYDFANSIFDGSFDFHTSDSFKGIFYEHGWMNLHFDKSNWHFLFGTPQNPTSLQVMSFFNVDAYLMAGTDIPAADFNTFKFKSQVEEALGGPIPSSHMPKAQGNVSGLAFGGSQYFDTGKITFLIFYGFFGLGYGFDVQITHDPSLLCENLGYAPGINNWYAQGRAYVWAAFEIGLHVDVWFTSGDFTILKAAAYANCAFMAPHPIWLSGQVAGGYSILDGLVSGYCSFTFEVGTKCVPSTESPLAVDIITDMKPNNGDKDVDVFAVPTATMAFPINQELDFDYTDENGQPATRTFKVVVDGFTVHDDTHNTQVDGYTELSSDAYTVKFISTLPYESNVHLTATVSVHGEEYIKGGWTQAKKRNGDPITASRSTAFTSGPRPNHIRDEDVAYSLPRDKQRHFLLGEGNSGYVAIQAGKDFRYLFSEPGTYIARFIPLNGGTQMETAASYNLGVRFQIPPLQANTAYAVQFVRQSPGGIMSASLEKSTFLGALSSITPTATVKSSLALQSTLSASSKSFMAGSGTQTTTGTGVAGAVGKGLTAIGGENGPLWQSMVHINERKMPGTEVRPNEKLLYLYYFQTSKFGTLAEKLAQLSHARTDYVRYGGSRELVTPVFKTAEGFDDWDISTHTLTSRSGDLSTLDPLVHIDAHAPQQRWFTKFAWPSIYAHVIDLLGQGLWPYGITLDDKFFLLLGLFNPNTTVQLASKPEGRLYVAAVGDPYDQFYSLIHVATKTPFGLSIVQPEVSFNYLHGMMVPDDYWLIYFQAHILAFHYSQGDYDDKQDWFSNAGWLWNLNAKTIADAEKAYTYMYPDNYVLSFIYSPKFAWNSSGPWINIPFRYGNLSPSKAVNAVKTTTTTTVFNRFLLTH